MLNKFSQLSSMKRLSKVHGHETVVPEPQDGPSISSHLPTCELVKSGMYIYMLAWGHTCRYPRGKEAREPALLASKMMSPWLSWPMEPRWPSLPQGSALSWREAGAPQLHSSYA